MFCRNCGNELPDGARFCGKCGASTGVGNSGGAYGGNRTGYGAAYNTQRAYGAQGGKKKTPLIVGIIAAAAAAIVLIVVLLGKGGGSAISTMAVLLGKGRGSAITDEMRKARVGDEVEFGSYEQDNNTSNGKEDIEWIVLDKDDDKLLLISKDILDCQPYNEEMGGITWEDCTLREWLNDDFLDEAFSVSEQQAIELSDIENDDNSEYGTGGGEDTEDKIFLLSIDEAERYFDLSDDRIAKLTDYGMERYIEGSVEYGWYDTEDEARERISEINEEYGYGWYWWLRSPGDYGNRAANVDGDGGAYGGGYVDYGGNYVYGNYLGVRPALWVDLES